MHPVMLLFCLFAALFVSACHGVGPAEPVVTPDYILELNSAGAGGGK